MNDKHRTAKQPNNINKNHFKQSNTRIIKYQNVRQKSQRNPKPNNQATNPYLLLWYNIPFIQFYLLRFQTTQIQMTTIISSAIRWVTNLCRRTISCNYQFNYTPSSRYKLPTFSPRHLAIMSTINLLPIYWTPRLSFCQSCQWLIFLTKSSFLIVIPPLFKPLVNVLQTRFTSLLYLTQYTPWQTRHNHHSETFRLSHRNLL
jgi:hypothetical protein